MLFAMNDRKMRVEVGRGLEGDLTDIEASEIIDTIRPYFKEQQYEQGIDAGVTKTIELISASSSATPIAGSQDVPPIVLFVLIAVVIVFVLIVLLGAYLDWRDDYISDWGSDSGSGPRDDSFSDLMGSLGAAGVGIS